MYIREVHIENIRSISKFDMKFREGEEAGWHVLIGDNGSGKTTILRSIALGLMGIVQINGLRENWNYWLNNATRTGKIQVQTYPLPVMVFEADISRPLILGDLILEKDKKGTVRISQNAEKKLISEFKEVFFSSGFGPFRRFTGGSEKWDEVFKNPSLFRLASHLSLFGEDVALSEITDWLKKLHTQNLEKRKEGQALEHILTLINSNGFLPHRVKFSDVSSDGIFFTDGNGVKIGVNQLSDGYRSILSLTFELIRQMILSYGADIVFENIRKNKMNIPLPGVVLIDEIDAHLHPTWQTRIGQWFTKYFPNLQFIVTTHSPLVCRACEKGSIWRLAAPGSEQESGEITGTDRDRLIFGNVLDAYGTEVFGKDVSISEDANDKLNRLGELNIKSIMGQPMTVAEEAEYYGLKSIFPTQRTK